MSRFEHLEFNDGLGAEASHQTAGFEVIDQYYYLARATEAFETDSFERALGLYSRALQYEIMQLEPWVGQIRCLIELGEMPEAVTWSNRALEKFPQASDILAARAVAEARMGNKETAQAFLDAAFKAKEISTYAWVARGDVLLSVNLANAKVVFDKAIEMSPRDAAVRSWIGRAHLVRKLWVQAAAHYREAVRLDENRFTAWYWIARCQEETGEYEDAKTSCEKALVIKPDFREAANMLERLKKMRGLSGVFTKLKKRLPFGR